MGIYDRDYYQRDRYGLSFSGPRTMVGTLILLNVAAYLADALFTSGGHEITGFLAVPADVLTRPWAWWKLITYGFAHDSNPQHVFLNMLGLFFLGPDIENTYGRREFLRIYLAALVAGSLTWAAINWAQGNPRGTLLGASGAVTAVVVLYALNFPHRTLLFFFVFPLPAWVVGLLVVFLDLYGAISRQESHVAYVVHLAGAALALLYFQSGLNFGRLLPDLSWLRRRPPLRLRWPPPDEEKKDDTEEGPAEDELSMEVDRILEKISRQGEASLTRKERRTLHLASRQYQKRHRGSQ